MSEVKRGKSPCYCINLRRAANAVSALYDTRLAPVNLSVNQFSLLVNLRRLGSGSVSDLANYVGLERSTLVRTLKPLLDRALILDEAAPGQRERALRLTPAGVAAIDAGLPLWESAQAEIKQRLGALGVEALSRALCDLIELRADL